MIQKEHFDNCHQYRQSKQLCYAKHIALRCDTMRLEFPGRFSKADYTKQLLSKMSNAMQFPIPFTHNNRLTITILSVAVVFNFQFCACVLNIKAACLFSVAFLQHKNPSIKMHKTLCCRQKAVQLPYNKT